MDSVAPEPWEDKTQHLIPFASLELGPQASAAPNPPGNLSTEHQKTAHLTGEATCASVGLHPSPEQGVTLLPGASCLIADRDAAILSAGHSWDPQQDLLPLRLVDRAGQSGPECQLVLLLLPCSSISIFTKLILLFGTYQ